MVKLSVPGVQQVVQEAFAGDIVLIAGLEDADIGTTITDSEDAELLPAIAIDEPTVAMQFLVNITVRWT